MEISPISKQYVEVGVTVTLADGEPATVSGVDVAVLPIRTSPTASTAWTEAEGDAGSWRVLVAGPSADPAGAVTVPAGGADLWMRVQDNPEVTAAKVVRINVV